MKHIKKFENFDLSPTEDPNSSDAKLDWNNMNDWISEFSSKRVIVEQAYMKYKDIKELRNILVSKGIADKDGDGINIKNPLLSIWAKASSYKRKISVLEKSLDLLRNTLKENTSKLATEPDLKDVVEQQNMSINDNIRKKMKEIQELNKEVSNTDNEVKEKIKEMKDKLKNDRKTIDKK